MKIQNLPQMTEEQLQHQQECIETFGKEAQMDICIEEMSELTKALCKLKRKIKKALPVKDDIETLHNNILEEIADVYITLTQMEMLFDDNSILSDIVNYKIQRNKDRM
jgi:hypothetical protein